MQCDVYRPKTRTDLYIFVKGGTNPNLTLAHLMGQFGELEFIKSREIISGQQLVGVSTDEILRNIVQSGLHIQGVTTSTQVSEGGAALGGGILGASIGGPVGAVIGAILGFALAEHAKKEPNEL